MTKTSLALVFALAGAALVTAFPPEARATGGDPAISMSPAASAASAAAPSTARRTLEFTAKHLVPTEFTLADPGHAPVGNSFDFIARFAGQQPTHACSLQLPKAGQVVKPGESAIGTIKCTSPWAVYDNGLSYEALENGRKIGGGTLRP